MRHQGENEAALEKGRGVNMKAGRRRRQVRFTPKIWGGKVRNPQGGWGSTSVFGRNVPKCRENKTGKHSESNTRWKRKKYGFCDARYPDRIEKV